jgi:fused signal recognition particle receptor
MALGFIKKVFSFGKKEVVEEKIDDSAPLPPINWEALKSDARSPPSRGDSTERRQVSGAAEDERAAETPPAGPPAHLPIEVEEPAAGPTEPQPIIPEPPVEPVPTPTPAEPGPQPRPDEPAPSPTPTEPVPPPGPEEPVPAPSPAEPEQPSEIPVPPSEIPGAPPMEIPAPAQPSQPRHAPSPAPVEIPTRAAEQQPYLEPAAEVPPPIRQPPPVDSDPLRDEIAPEPAPTPSPVRRGSLGHPSAETQEARAEAGQGRVAERPRPAEETPSRPSAHLPIVGGEPALSPTPRKVTVAKAVEKRAEPRKAPEPVPRVTWFQRLKQGLSRSSRELSSNIAGVFTKRKLDEDTLQDLEDVLIRADLGMETAIRITDALASGRYGKDVSEGEVRSIMAEEVEKVLGPVALPLELDLSHKPHVILVVGVNGTGKTTTIGKLAAKLVTGGLSVTLAAGDTFRAAAIEQLKIWGERTGSPVVASKLGADAAGLAYDAFEKAKEAGSDVLIIDTAGRLQNKAELMAELEKIVRVLGKLDPEAPHTVLQTVDATTGQNALNQVEIFRNVAGVNGLVMTKLDGTARGGILVAIAAKHRLPVYFIGVGEQVDDLEPFSASDFAKAIAGVA